MIVGYSCIAVGYCWILLDTTHILVYSLNSSWILLDIVGYYTHSCILTK